MCVVPELAKGLSEIYNYNVFWLSSNFLTHLCSILESKPSFMNPAFTRKNLENQFPSSSATRAQVYELGSTSQNYIGLGSEDFKEKAVGGNHFAGKGDSKAFFQKKWDRNWSGSAGSLFSWWDSPRAAASSSWIWMLIYGVGSPASHGFCELAYFLFINSFLLECQNQSASVAHSGGPWRTQPPAPSSVTPSHTLSPRAASHSSGAGALARPPGGPLHNLVPSQISFLPIRSRPLGPILSHCQTNGHSVGNW